MSARFSVVNLEDGNEKRLRCHYEKTGDKWPGKKICSEVRWRMFLAKMKNPERFVFGEEP